MGSIVQRTGLVIGAFAAVVMTIAIATGMAAGGFVDGLRLVAGDPWGRVTLIDLGVGLLIVAVWIAWREPSLGRAVPWWIALALTGNLAAGVYLIVAARKSATAEEFLLGAHA